MSKGRLAWLVTCFCIGSWAVSMYISTKFPDPKFKVNCTFEIVQCGRTIDSTTETHYTAEKKDEYCEDRPGLGVYYRVAKESWRRMD